MEQLTEQINIFLTKIYQNVTRFEEMTIKSSGRIDLTINEMHMIECVGKSGDRGKIISDIAIDMGVKSPSVTVAVNKLVKKGYFEKKQSSTDGRVVLVGLTKKGKRIHAYHSYYHRIMIKDLTCDLDENEAAVLLKALDKLNQYFVRGVEEHK